MYESGNISLAVNSLHVFLHRNFFVTFCKQCLKLCQRTIIVHYPSCNIILFVRQASDRYVFVAFFKQHV